jgi:hypothetical protein
MVEAVAATRCRCRSSEVLSQPLRRIVEYSTTEEVEQLSSRRLIRSGPLPHVCAYFFLRHRSLQSNHVLLYLEMLFVLLLPTHAAEIFEDLHLRRVCTRQTVVRRLYGRSYGGWWCHTTLLVKLPTCRSMVIERQQV